jgi:hypothetical protein
VLIRFRSSTTRSEATLTPVSQEVGCSTDPLISLRVQLSNIQESVSKTHDAVMFQATTVNSVLQSISVAPRSHLYATNELPSTQGALSSGEWYNEYTKHETHLNNGASRNYAVSRRSLSPEPVTILEASRNFFAESYTVDAQVPISCLVVINSFEQLTRVDSKTNIYKLIYLNQFRHWQWLTISIQIPCSSRYWAATKTTQQDKSRMWQGPALSSPAVLPYSLLKKIQVFLCQGEESNDNARMYLSLSDRDTVKRRPQVSRTDALSTPSRPLSTPSNALTYLHDLGCRRYDESEVVQIKTVDPPNCFCSSLNGILVYEIKFQDSTPTVGMLYAIRVLHYMNGSPGFTKLTGIVTDDSRRYLKSYLIQLPMACWNLLKMAENPSVSWQRREKWANQIVRGVSQIHAHSFVVGGLHTWTVPVIDNTDSVQFWSFKERFVTGRIIGAYYPPEFLHVRDIPPTVDEADSPYLTSKTDIFHLGLILWLLAENKPETRASPVCRRRGCNKREDKRKDGNNTCDLSHAEPIALPPLPESIPKYFKDIVYACRREDPSTRPAAREILEMFPSSDENSPDHPNHDQKQRGHGQPNLFSQQNHTPDIQTLADGVSVAKIACSICAKRPVPLPFYHCNSCNYADFDLCQTCYDRGMHCDDDEHLLVEMGKIGSWIVPRRYHSCVKGSVGERDVIDL